MYLCCDKETYTELKCVKVSWEEEKGIFILIIADAISNLKINVSFEVNALHYWMKRLN